MMRKGDLVIRFVKPGYEIWPGVPPPRLYFKSRHLHKFEVVVGTEVRHEDQVIEEHQLLDEADELLEVADDTMPCEQLARVVANRLMALHSQRIFTVTISEDGEGRATVSSGQ